MCGIGCLSYSQFLLHVNTIRYENARIVDNQIDRLNFHFAKRPHAHTQELGCVCKTTQMFFVHKNLIDFRSNDSHGMNLPFSFISQNFTYFIGSNNGTHSSQKNNN